MNKSFMLLLLLIPVLFGSCVQYQDLLNYHDLPNVPTTPQAITNYKPVVIQPNDILNIRVSSTAIEAAAPFNSGDEGGGYLVDENGNVNLPTLGPIRLADLTLETAKLNLQKALQPYFSEKPIVSIRLVNFKININGEIGSPGVFSINTGRVTIVEAMTLAGDFTPYSRRDSILIIREFKNERTFGYVDFTSTEVFNSPYFYLQQNDVIYVQPTKSKVATVRDPASRAIPYISIATGFTALMLSLLRIF